MVVLVIMKEILKINIKLIIYLKKKKIKKNEPQIKVLLGVGPDTIYLNKGTYYLGHKNVKFQKF